MVNWNFTHFSYKVLGRQLCHPNAPDQKRASALASQIASTPRLLHIDVRHQPTTCIDSEPDVKSGIRR